MALEITDDLRLDESELEFHASPGGGPGGQNVNRVATKVTLRFDVGQSPSLGDDQRARLLSALSSRLTKDGVLHVVSQTQRTQGANRREARERLAEILQDALEIPKERRPTKPSRRAKRRRLDKKRQRSQVKKGRGRRWGPDD